MQLPIVSYTHGTSDVRVYGFLDCRLRHSKGLSGTRGSYASLGVISFANAADCATLPAP